MMIGVLELLIGRGTEVTWLRGLVLIVILSLLMPSVLRLDTGRCLLGCLKR